jgi:hypothetical protein
VAATLARRSGRGLDERGDCSRGCTSRLARAGMGIDRVMQSIRAVCAVNAVSE